MTPSVTHRANRPEDPPREETPALVPFRVGEALDYQVRWASFSSAASVQLTVAERRSLYGWDTWHFRAVAHTLNPVRALFALDDQFDSYTDALTFASHQYEMYLREWGRERSAVFHLVPEASSNRAPGSSVIVLPGTRDPVGAVYVLRQVNWQRTPEVRAPVFDGRNLYEMRARLEVPREDVAVASGRYSADRIGIRLSEGGRQISQMRFELWLANNAARTPVLLEAEMPFGTLRAELIRANP